MPAADADAALGLILELIFLDNSRPIQKAILAMAKKLLPPGADGAAGRLAALLQPRVKRELAAVDGDPLKQARFCFRFGLAWVKAAVCSNWSCAGRCARVPLKRFEPLAIRSSARDARLPACCKPHLLLHNCIFVRC